MIEPTWFAWLCSIFMVLIIIAYSRIVWRDYKNLQQLKQDEHTYSKYQNRLRIFALSTMIWCGVLGIAEIMRLLFCGPFAVSLVELAFFSIRIFTTFYQLARLQYCFSAQQIHSDKYGYSNKTFICLYISGIAMVLMLIIKFILDIILSVVNPNEVSKENFLCNVDHDANDSIINTFDTLIMAVSFFIFYLIWDWIIIILYIKKCYQFEKKSDNVGNMTESVKLRVKYILSKILFLTILIEIKTTLSLVSSQLLYIFPEFILYLILYWILAIFDGFVCTYLISLMLSHNDDKYIKFIVVIQKMKCHIQILIYIVIDKNIDHICWCNSN